MNPRHPLHLPLLWLDLQRQAWEAWMRLCMGRRY